MKKNTVPSFGMLMLSTLAPMAVAQTSISAYGVIDLAIQSGHTGGATTTRLDSSSIAPSRFGFQGSEDLGNGMQALFRLENGFNADTGAIANGGVLFGREAWVGLKGRFGQAQLGLNYTPLFQSYVTYAQGELNTLGWGNATNNFVFVPVARVANSVRYTSPAMGNVTVRGLYSLGNENAAGQPRRLGNTASIGLNYRDNALTVDLDYLQQTYSAAALTASSPVNTGKYYLAGLSYDFGFIKPAILFQKHTGSSDVVAANGASFANPENYFYEINALIRGVARGTVLVSYGQYKRQSSSAGDAKSLGIRYDYPLSKRTGLYAGVSRIENGSAANFTTSLAAGPGIPTAAGSDINSVALGVVHRF